MVSSIEYSYTVSGRLAQVAHSKEGTTVTSSFTYNSHRERVAVEANGQRTTYLLDRMNPTGYSQTLVETETDLTGVVTERTTYVIGHDQLGQAVTSISADGSATTETHQFLHDFHSSVRGLIDAQAALTEAYVYAAYGELLALYNSVQQPRLWRVASAGKPLDVAAARTRYLYAGEAFDQSTGLSNNRARWYAPQNGRFLGLDEYAGSNQRPQTYHKYAFAHSNPVNGLDPSGLVTTSELISISTIAGVLSTVLVTGVNVANAPGPDDGTIPDQSAEMISGLFEDALGGPAFRFGGRLVRFVAGKAIDVAASQSARLLHRLASAFRKTKAGYVIYGGLDALGRPRGVMAQVTSETLRAGSDAAGRIRPPGFDDLAPSDRARGHLLAAVLGGAGNLRENLVAIMQSTNQEIFTLFERPVRD